MEKLIPVILVIAALLFVPGCVITRLIGQCDGAAGQSCGSVMLHNGFMFWLAALAAFVGWRLYLYGKKQYDAEQARKQAELECEWEEQKRAEARREAETKRRIEQAADQSIKDIF